MNVGPPRRRTLARLLFTTTSLIALAAGGWAALRWWWVSDDAFISFRYARNLVEGLGLVFNPGERVEAFTNLLWTLWVAAGLAIGCAAESWANAWGIAFYLASILLLGLHQRQATRALPSGEWAIPIAGLGAALHQDWAAFATGGLETSLFTFLLISGYLIVLRAGARRTALVAAGLVFGLA